MHTITVATFNSARPAERLRGWLQKAGVTAFVRDQRKLQRLWFLAKPYGSFHLDVDKAHFEKANELLSDWQETKHALADSIRCPLCHSLRVEYPHMTRKFVLPTLMAHLLTLVGLTRHQFYCADCQNTWNYPTKTGSLSIHLRSH